MTDIKNSAINIVTTKVSKLIISLFTLVLFFICLPLSSNVEAITVFSDDFNDGNADGWSTPGRNGGLWTVEDGMYGARIEDGDIIISSLAGDIPTPNYILEFEILPKAGDDKNIDFRWRDNSNNYGIHFNNDTGGINIFGKAGPTQEDWPKLTTFGLHNNQKYHFKIILNEKHIQVFVDDTQIFDEIDPDYMFTTNEQVGFRISTGASYPTEVWFDNVLVTSIGDPVLNVPLLKQTDISWGGNIYDSANLWSPQVTGINAWGCALTSAAMVLQYHGITKLPNGTTLDPGTLNTWLNSQSDGYVGNGYINWLAVSRLSKLAKASGNNSSFTHDALEYTRIFGNVTQALSDNISSGNPGILEEPGHFLVGKGISGDTFTINDPYYSREKLTDGYGNSFLSLGTYTPSNTDLSYIMLVTDPKTSFVTITNNFEQFVQNPIINPLNNTQKNNPPIKIGFLKKPNTDVYTFTIHSEDTGIKKIEGYFYDKNGSLKKFVFTMILSPNANQRVTIDFNKDFADQILANRIVTFDVLIQDINLLNKNGQIQNTVAKSLTTIAQNAQKNRNNQKFISKQKNQDFTKSKDI